MKRDRRGFAAADNSNDLAKSGLLGALDQHVYELVANAFSYDIVAHVDAVFARARIRSAVAELCGISVANDFAGLGGKKERPAPRG